MFKPAAKESRESMMEFESPVRRHPPAFNVPRIIPWLIGLLAGIHLFRLYGPVSDETVIYYFAFIPARFGGTLPVGDSLLEQGARFWSLVTYSFLHADWVHWGFNSVSMLAFGTPLARRLGALRFLLLSAFGSIGGALAYYLFHPSQIAVLIGASAAISAQVAGAIRLIFARPALVGTAGERQIRPPRALTLSETFTTRMPLMFILVWLGLNYVFGASGIGMPAGEGLIAWEAHLGGFIAGLFLLGLLERKPSP
jgi:membrane associated rhomboid family serine protease